MIHFVYPERLWLLVFLPLLAYLRGNRYTAPAVIFSCTSLIVTGTSRYQAALRIARHWLRLPVLFCLIITLARPQLDNPVADMTASGIDILLAVNISPPIGIPGNLAQRQQDAIAEILTEFINARPNDRIGLLSVTDQTHLVSPLTLDHHWLRSRLDTITTGMPSEQGAAIGPAIALGTAMLDKQQSRVPILILLTDGVTATGELPPLLAAEAARALTVKVYTIGAWSEKKLSPPIITPGAQPITATTESPIDESTLQDIANLTGGQYYRTDGILLLKNIYHEIDSIEATTRVRETVTPHRVLFPVTVGLAIVLLLFELAIREQFLL